MRLYPIPLIVAMATVAIGGCSDLGIIAADDASQLQAFHEAIEARALAAGATPTQIAVFRHALELEDGQVLEFGHADRFADDDDPNIVRRIDLPDGRKAVIRVQG